LQVAANDASRHARPADGSKGSVIVALLVGMGYRPCSDSTASVQCAECAVTAH
jgi:hypothetical protein